MQYGHFSQDRKEYIITNPNTPKPWFNYLFNDSYHALVSHTGGGFSYYKDPKFYRFLKYDHLSTDRPGRYCFIRDSKTKDVWSINWQPIRKKLQSWQCTHGLGYTRIESKNKGINSELTYIVTLKDPAELWKVKLTNSTKSKKHLKLFPMAEFICGDIAIETHYRNILMLYNQAGYDKKNKAIVAFKHSFQPKKNFGFGFMATDQEISGFDTNRDIFWGQYNDCGVPEIVSKGKCSDTECRGEDMLGTFEIDVELKAGESKEMVMLLGYTEKKTEIANLIKKYNSVKKFDAELEKIKKYWTNHIEKLHVKTPDDDFNTMANIWGKYQLLAITHWRGTSQYHGVEGGLGYRDTAQDAEGLFSQDTKLARAKLEKILYYQYNCGHAVSGFSDIEGTWEKMGQAGLLMKADVAVWLPYAVISYLKETGDFDYLDKVVPFHDGGEATVYEHVLRAVRYLFSALGKHGLPLIGKADWNDAYDAVGIKGKGESVWLGMALCRACQQVAELAEFVEDYHIADEMKKMYKKMYTIVNKVGWDGDWYLAAFNDKGLKIGSKENKEGKVPLNSQTWAILSGVVTEKRLPKILKQIDGYLDTDFGPALFLPSYTSYNPNIGRVTAFAEGTKENAAVFSHACAFKIVSDCMLKRGKQAFDTYKKLCPMSKSKQDHNKHKVEPYVWAEYVVGPGSGHRFGEGAFTWNTGTSPWMFTAATEWIIGVRRELGGLLIDPCIPSNWKKCFIRRPFRGATYEVTIKNPKGLEHGVKYLIVDGKKQASNLITPHHDGKVHKVEAVMG